MCVCLLTDMDYESQVFPRCGGSGPYSRLVVVSTWLPSFAAVLNLCCDAFYSLVPELYHCRPDPALLPAAALLLTNYSAQGYLDLAVPRTNGSGLSHCLLYKYPMNISAPAAPHGGAGAGGGDLPFPREKVPCTRGWEYTHGAGLRSNYVTEVLYYDDYYYYYIKSQTDGGGVVQFMLCISAPRETKH